MIAASLHGVGLDVRDGARGRRRVLDRITMHLEYGEAVAVMGRSGSGKSSLLSCLAGIQDRSEGQIRVDGHDLAELDAAGRASLRAHRVALLLQGDDLLPALTVQENVEILHRIRGESPPLEAIDAALGAVGLTSRSDSLPEALSGGERRRAALARVMVQGPRLTLLDEPTDGLDPRSTAVVVELMRERARAGSALLVATHDLWVASTADRVLVLDSGRLSCELIAPSSADLAAVFDVGGAA
jgi:putative ABC transport system ATP-binding protein